MDLHRITHEHRILAVQRIGHGTGSVAGNAVHGHRHAAAEGERLSAPDQDRRLHFPGDDGLGGCRLLADAVGIIQIPAPALHILIHMGLTGPQQRRVRFVDDHLSLAPGELPQGLRPAEVVNVSVREQDPADLVDAPSELFQCRNQALGRGRRDAGVNDGRLGCVNEIAVETEPAPRRDQRMDGGCHRMPCRKSRVCSKGP
ncbi:hypothetical protein ABIB35_001047 [Arthrobacter sp. UYP6]